MQVYGIHRERKFSPPALNSLASMNSRQFHQFMNEMLDCVAFLNAFLTELDELTVHMETYHDVGCFNRERNKALEVYGAWNDWIIFPFLQESWRRQRGSKLGRKGELFERNLNTLTKRALELSLNVTTRQASNKQRMITNTMTVVSSWEALISCVIATHSHKNEDEIFQRYSHQHKQGNRESAPDAAPSDGPAKEKRIAALGLSSPL